MYVINLEETSFYREFQAQREEINKHKWYESERAGRDIGWCQALIDWTIRFKTQWLQSRRKTNQSTSD
jgi:hypothetical protein